MIWDSNKLKEFADSLVGMSELEAEQECRDHDYGFRKTKIDGHPLMKTNDYRPGRMNVHLRDGKVEYAYYG